MREVFSQLTIKTLERLASICNETLDLVKERENQRLSYLVPRMSIIFFNSFMTEVPTIDLLCKSIDWFLYDRDLRHER